MSSLVKHKEHKSGLRTADAEEQGRDDRICHCGTKFTPRTRKQRWCSSKCYQASYFITNRDKIQYYRAANSEKFANYCADYYTANADKIAAYNKKNKKRKAKRQAAYRAAHAEEIAKQQAAYRATHRDESAKYRAAYRAAHADENAKY
jgi:hypothetical protein